MGSFSERMGIVKPREAFQTESMDVALTNGLWNLFVEFFLEKCFYKDANRSENNLKSLWYNFFKNPITTIPFNSYGTYQNESILKIIEKYFLCEAMWNQKYDFIEFILISFNKYTKNPQETISIFNKLLLREKSGYRLLENGTFIRVTDETEIAAIEEALATANANNLKGVQLHLETALKKLSDRENPDYRNSIKESISAVEAAMSQMTGEKSKNMTNAIGVFEKKFNIKIHGALNSALQSLYGYTSDEEGIRHPMFDDPNVNYEDAKFMLVSCSAFINYLTAKKSNKC